MKQNDTPMTRDDAVSLLALWRCPSVGPARFRKILANLSHPGQILDPAISKHIAEQLPSAAKDHLLSLPLRTQLIAGAEADWDWGQQTGHHIFFDSQADFPHALRPFSDAPPVLFASGSLDCLNMPQIAVVGSRHPSRYGKDQTKVFAQSLVTCGFSITSGLALGIDAFAHEATLSAKGKTIAVLGHGLDQIYPRSNGYLAQRILEQDGLLLSEFPIGVGPRKEFFPRRNRIMSALSLGVLVIEAAVRSGSLITARLAATQGKEVFALPGSIQNILSKGCHQLIREGAILVESVKDIVEVLKPIMGIQLKNVHPDLDVESLKEFRAGCAQSTLSSTPEADPLDVLNPVQRQIYQALADEPSSMDSLVYQTQLSPQALLTELMVMELKALVRTVPGGYEKI